MRACHRELLTHGLAVQCFHLPVQGLYDEEFCKTRAQRTSKGPSPENGILMRDCGRFERILGDFCTGRTGRAARHMNSRLAAEPLTCAGDPLRRQKCRCVRTAFELQNASQVREALLEGGEGLLWLSMPRGTVLRNRESINAVQNMALSTKHDIREALWRNLAIAFVTSMFSARQSVVEPAGSSRPVSSTQRNTC